MSEHTDKSGANTSDDSSGLFGKIHGLYEKFMSMVDSMQSTVGQGKFGRVELALAALGIKKLYEARVTIWGCIVYVFSLIMVGVDWLVDPYKSFTGRLFVSYCRAVRLLVPLGIVLAALSIVLILCGLTHQSPAAAVVWSIMVVMSMVAIFDYVFLTVLWRYRVPATVQTPSIQTATPARPRQVPPVEQFDIMIGFLRNAFIVLLIVTCAVTCLMGILGFYKNGDFTSYILAESYLILGAIIFSLDLFPLAILVIVRGMRARAANVVVQGQAAPIQPLAGMSIWSRRLILYCGALLGTVLFVAVLTGGIAHGEPINIILAGPYLLIMSTLMMVVLLPALWLAWWIAHRFGTRPTDAKGKPVGFVHFMFSPVLRTLFFIIGTAVTLKLLRVFNLDPEYALSVILAMIVLGIAAASTSKIAKVLKSFTISNMFIEIGWVAILCIIAIVVPSPTDQSTVLNTGRNAVYANFIYPLINSPITRVAGDINFDQAVNNEDLELLKQYLLTKTGLSAIDSAYCDVDGNGIVNQKDANLFGRALSEQRLTLLRAPKARDLSSRLQRPVPIDSVKQQGTPTAQTASVRIPSDDQFSGIAPNATDFFNLQVLRARVEGNQIAIDVSWTRTHNRSEAASVSAQSFLLDNLGRRYQVSSVAGFPVNGKYELVLNVPYHTTLFFPVSDMNGMRSVSLYLSDNWNHIFTVENIPIASSDVV